MSAAFLRSAHNIPSCSGRAFTSTILQRGIIQAVRHSGLNRRGAVVQALYNFADAVEERQPGQRRNRGLLKKEAREVLDVVRGLAIMTPKQLAAVEHLLPPGVIQAVGIAARLPRSNQGRKRQEALVAKMLRGQLSEQQLDKLEAAVSLATDHRGIFEDSDVSSLVAVWREGLLAGDQAVESEVFGYSGECVPDPQQLRTLVRQCQQTLQEEEEAQQAAQIQTDTPTSSASDSDSGDEELAAVLAEAAARSGAGSAAGGPGAPRKGRKARAPEPRSRGLCRSLDKMLRPLAIRVVQEGVDG